MTIKKNAIKALVFDLDNTIYSVASIAPQLFGEFYRQLGNRHELKKNFVSIKNDLQRLPFQVVAKRYDFSPQLYRECIKYLSQLKYQGKIFPFESYSLVRKVPFKKFLVTTGFTNLQKSKINALGIQDDFEQINIVDPLVSNRTKKDVFVEMLLKYQLSPHEVLVLGDDIQSEIKAAEELGMQSVLFDPSENYSNNSQYLAVKGFREFFDFVMSEK